MITLTFFLDKRNKPSKIFIASGSSDAQNCPAHTLHTHTTVFKHTEGPFHMIMVQLQLLSMWLLAGVIQNSTLKKMGSWNTNALQRYILIDSFSVWQFLHGTCSPQKTGGQCIAFSALPMFRVWNYLHIPLYFTS